MHLGKITVPPPPLLPSGPTPVNPDPPAWSGSSDLLPPGLPPSRYLSGLSPQLPAPCLSPPLLPRPNSWLATRLGAVGHTMHLFIPSRQRELILRSPSVGHIQEGKRLGGREKLSHPCLAPTSLAPTSLAPTARPMAAPPFQPNPLRSQGPGQSPLAGKPQL